MLKVLAVQSAVVNADFRGGAGVQRVQQFGVAQEHGGLVLFGRDGVIDVGEADGFGEFGPILKNPVRPEAADGYGVLYGFGRGKPLPVLFQRVLQSFNQLSMPP